MSTFDTIRNYVQNGLATTTQKAPWSNPFLIALFGGATFVVFYAYRLPNSFQSVAIGLLIAGAAFAVSAAVGFLFGIPKALQQTTAPSSDDSSRYAVNTNLEQISDWLTKIIVGLGLTQIGTIPGQFMSLATYLATAFDGAVPASMVAALISYFGVCGFLTFYLYTRLFLTQEFSRADRIARESSPFSEGIIHALLYQPAPAGFEEAIQKAEEYVSRFGDDNWRVWRSIACAYGQKHQYLQRQPSADKDLLALCKAKSLDAVKKVLEINPSEKSSLRSLWDPKLTTPQENDLQTYSDDPDFQKLFNEH